MWLTSVSIRRPIFIIMFVLALIVLGWQSRSKMPAELEPKIDFPYITVLTTYAGAGPNEMETLVSEKIEKQVASIGNLRNVTSSSQEGVSTVLLEFELGTDVDSAAADVRDKVSAIRQDLPKDADEPKILKLDIASQPVLTIGLAGPLSPKEMRILADDVISDRFAKVGGVASVNVEGGDVREVSVAVDKDRLQAYNVGIDKAITAIKAANLNVPAGSIKQGAREYSIRTVGEFNSADEIANVRIYMAPLVPGGMPTMVRVGDIATIKDTIAEPDRITRLNGKPSVVFTVQKQSDANTVEVCEGVKRELKEVQPILPAGVKPVIAMDESKFVEEALDDVNASLFYGILLVVLIVFLFLHTARATFIVAIAIPTSIFATYTPIHAFGFTLNTMTLLALSLVVGILVDDSIVVLENIERHLRLRKRPDDAAIDGRSEIGLAAITITAVDVVVFVPIAFMGGLVGQFFRQFGLTVAVATTFSLLMSFMLTPMLASRWMKSEEDKERDDEEREKRLRSGRGTAKDKTDRAMGSVFGVSEAFLSGLNVRYRGLLEWALANRFMVIVIGFVSLLVVFALTMPLPTPQMGAAAGAKMLMPRVVIALVALGLAFAAMYHSRSKKVALVFGVMMAVIAMTIYLPFGFGMFPDVDRGELQVTVRTPPGTSLAGTDKVVRQVEAILRTVPEMKNGYYMTLVGASQTGTFGGAALGSQYAVISVKVADKKDRKRGIQDICDWIAARTAHIAGAELISVVAESGRGSGMSGVMMEVQGQNMGDIIEQSDRLAAIMRKTPGLVDVDISYKPNKPERRIIVDRIRAAQFDMNVQKVAVAARTAIDGDDTAKLRDSGTEYPIRVQFAKSERSQPSDVENLIIGSSGGAPVYIKDVAKVVYDLAPAKIDRKNRQRVIYVTANLAKGIQLGNVGVEIDQAYQKSKKVAGTTVATGGMGKIMAESFGYMGSSLILAVLLVYMLMGALFESFLTPFVIMFSLPQAMVGALLALLITGNPLSIVAMIGIIMLMGLVTKNAILLVDYTNTLRGQGLNRQDALLQAGPTRLRPILMTTLAMIGGMMPTALALNEGAEMRAPMAIAVIGGLILSTLLTLIVIPVAYTIVDDAWHWLLRTFFRSAYERSKEKQLVAECEMASVIEGD